MICDLALVIREFEKLVKFTYKRTVLYENKCMKYRKVCR